MGDPLTRRDDPTGGTPRPSGPKGRTPRAHRGAAAGASRDARDRRDLDTERAVEAMLRRVAAGGAVDAAWARKFGDDAAVVTGAARVRDLMRAAAGAGGARRKASRAATHVRDDVPPVPRLGPWRLVERLGDGGMGVVWLGERDDAPRRSKSAAARRVATGATGATARARRDDGTPPRVAVKFIRPELLATPSYRRRFLREASAGARIVHPNVVRTIASGVAETAAGARPYLVLEHVEGRDLRDLVEGRRPTPEPLCRHVARELAGALAAVHAEGLVHRDVKPSNVRLGPGGTVKLMDLGVVQVADASTALSAPGSLVGTLPWAAPEQVAGRPVDGRADLYALGLVLFELATGRPPVDASGDFAAVVRRVLEETPPRIGSVVRGVSPFFDDVVCTLLRKRPEERFASAAVLAETLERGEESAWWHARAGAVPAADARRQRVPRAAPLVGRDEAIRSLADAVAAAEGGTGAVVLVEGEAGAGKSRFVEETLERLAAREGGLHVLHGGHAPGGGATSAGAFVAAFADFLGEDGLAVRLRGLLPGSPALAAGLASVLRGEPAPEAERLDRDGLRSGLAKVLRALAAEKPAVLAIEDLHFAPPDALALFAGLAAALGAARVVLVGTSRPGLDAAWLADVLRLPHVRRIELPRLSDDDVARVVAHVVGSTTAGARLAPRLARATDGNPYFLVEVLRDLRERGASRGRGDTATAAATVTTTVDVPSSVRTLLRARVAALDPPDREALEVAACCGFRFDGALVAEALARPTLDVLRALARIASSHGIVRAAGAAFEFDHHQVHEVVRADVAEPLRRWIHGSIAAALLRAVAASGSAADGETSAAICRHAVGAGRPADGLPFVDRAATHLDDTLRSREAAELLGDVLAGAAGTVPAGERARLFLRLGKLREGVRDVASAEQAYGAAVTAAEEADDPRLVAEALRQQGFALDLAGRGAEGLVPVERALRVATEAGNDLERSRVLGSWGAIAYHLGDFETALRRGEESLAIAQRIGAEDVERMTRGNLSHVLDDLGRPLEALEHADRALVLSRHSPDRRVEMAALLNRAGVLIALLRHAEAADLFREAITIARAHGLDRAEAVALSNLGIALSAMGDWAGALDHYVMARAIADQRGEPYVAGIAAINEAGILSRWGDREAARAALSWAREALHRIGARRPESQTIESLGWAAIEAGDLAAAESLCREALAIRETIGFARGIVESSLCLGEILARTGRRDEAVRAFRTVRERAAAAGLTETRAQAAAWLVIVGDEPASSVAGLDETAGAEIGVRGRMELRWLLWRATGERRFLDGAREILDAAIAAAPPERREAMRTRVALHREILGASGGGAGRGTSGGRSRRGQRRGGRRA